MIFDHVKLFSQEGTNEILVKYVCSDCGKVMNDPPYYYAEIDPQADYYFFLCKECYGKKIKEIVIYEE